MRNCLTTLALAFIATLAVLGASPAAARDTSSLLNGFDGEPVVHLPLDMPPVPLSGTVDGGASAVATVHESLFQKLVAKALPVVIAEVRKLSIPGEKQKHFEFSTIHLSAFNIGSFTIGFAAPNKVVIALKGLVLQVPKTGFEVKAKVLFAHLHCKGDFEVKIGAHGNTPTDITVTFDLQDNAGHLALANGAASVRFGALDISHKFHGVFCKVGESIVKLFVGNIDKLIRKLVEKDISPLATKAIGSIFKDLEGKIHVPLTRQPVATADSMQVAVNIMPGAADKHGPLLLQTMPVKSAFAARDIEAMITEVSANNLLRHFFAEKKLDIGAILPVNTSIFKLAFPGAYERCPDCPMRLSDQFLSAPLVRFDASAGLEVTNLVLAFDGMRGDSVVPLFEITLNGTFMATDWKVTGAAGTTIKFDLSVPTFAFREYRTWCGHFETQALQDVIDFVLQRVALPIFNDKFKGITILPLAGGIQLESLEVAWDHAARLGFNVRF